MAICLSHLILLSSKARKTFKFGVSDWFLACVLGFVATLAVYNADDIFRVSLGCS